MQRRHLDGDVGNSGRYGSEASAERVEIGQSSAIELGINGLSELGFAGTIMSQRQQSDYRTNDVDDGSQVGPLLDQIDDPIASMTGDGAYDQDGVYGEVAARHPDAACRPRYNSRNPRDLLPPSVALHDTPPAVLEALARRVVYVSS